MLAFDKRLRIPVLKKIAINIAMKIASICPLSVWMPIILIKMMLISRMTMLKTVTATEIAFEVMNAQSLSCAY